MVGRLLGEIGGNYEKVPENHPALMSSLLRRTRGDFVRTGLSPEPTASYDRGRRAPDTRASSIWCHSYQRRGDSIKLAPGSPESRLEAQKTSL